jgi:hypothetical protein
MARNDNIDASNPMKKAQPCNLYDYHRKAMIVGLNQRGTHAEKTGTVAR